MKKSHKVLITSLLLISQNVFAGVTHLLYEETFSECYATASHDAVPGGEGVLVIRAATNDHEFCTVDQQHLLQVLERGLIKLKEESELSAITSIFLGRIHAYPWMSHYILESSEVNKLWDTKSGRPVKGSANQYINTLLGSTIITTPFSRILTPAGYNLTGISCEKVLLNDENLPYDALCWITVR